MVCISAAPAAFDRIPCGLTGHVAHPSRSIETRSLPTLTHVLPPIRPLGFPIYVARRPAAPLKLVLFPSQSPLPIAALPSMSLSRKAPGRHGGLSFYACRAEVSTKVGRSSDSLRSQAAVFSFAGGTPATTAPLVSCIISGLRSIKLMISRWI
jgi:hypothetical protein